MRKIILAMVFILSLLVNSMAWAAPAQIAVAIELDKLAVQLRGHSDYKVLDVNDKVLYESIGKQNAFLNVKDGILYINNEKLPDNVYLVPATDSFIEVNRRIYRGSFNVYTNRDNTIQVINVVPVDYYVTSVLAKEIENGFNEEVIKAQAVAIRSQAYFFIAASRSNYDVVANNLERGGVVYLGKESESDEAIKAVGDTAGEVMLYNGQPIFAMWHMSSGGYTENGSEFFNAELPYLKMVKDADDSSKFYRWKYDFTPADLDAAFERAGYNLGKIEMLKLSPMPQVRPNSKPAKDRSPAGRLKEVTVVGEQGRTLVLPAQKFVSILGLNSNLFDVIIGTPLPKDIIATGTDPFGNEYEINRIEVNISERAGYKLPGDDESTHRVSRTKDDKIVFYGYGMGSGFGLSQQGAQTMALNALKAKKDKIKEQEQQAAVNARKLPAAKDAAKAQTAAGKTAEAKQPRPATIAAQADQSKKAAKPETTTKQDAGKKDVSKQDAVKTDAAKQDATNAKQETAKPTGKNKKTEEITLDKDYYKKILNYYFTGVIIEKVY